MIKLGIIGCGNAGGQIADLAKATKNIPGVVINTSGKDIANVKNVITFKVGDNRGAGKDRARAKSFVKQMIRQLLSQEKFKNHIEESEVLAVIASTGGGTGSGISIMLTDLLSTMYQDKKFIIVHVLPSLKESLASQQNTIEYLKEMKNFDATYMTYDNGCKDNLPSNSMMTEMNKEIVEDLAVIRGDYLESTPFTSIDEEDLTKIIEVPGRLIVHRLYDIKEKDIENVSIEEMFINKMRNNGYATELLDDKVVKKMGVILNVTEKLSNKIDTNLTSFKDSIGHPIEGFEHIAILEPGTKVKNKLITISSGLSLPEDRIEKINERIEEIMDELKSKHMSKSVLDAIETEDLSSLRKGRTASKLNVEDINIDDLLNKY